VFPTAECQTAGFGARPTVAEPIGPIDQPAIRPVVGVWRELFIADQAIGPGIGDADFHRVFAWLQHVRHVDAIRRLPEDPQVSAVELRFRRAARNWRCQHNGNGRKKQNVSERCLHGVYSKASLSSNETKSYPIAILIARATADYVFAGHGGSNVEIEFLATYGLSCCVGGDLAHEARGHLRTRRHHLAHLSHLHS